MENSKGQNPQIRKQLEKNTNKRNPFASSNQHQGLNIDSANESERSIDNSDFREMLEMDGSNNKGSGNSQRQSNLMKHLKAFEDDNQYDDHDDLDNAILLDDSVSHTNDQGEFPKIKEQLVALLLQMRLCNVDEDMIKEDKIREETQKLGVMALIRVITKRVEELINFKLLNDIQKDDQKPGQSDTMRNLLKDIHQRSQMSGLDEVEQMSANLDEFEILQQQAKDLSKPAKKRYDEKKDESEVQSQSDSHFTSIAGPPEVYEEIMQGLEADIRKHIRIEHQLKLHIESVEDRVEELEREQDGYLKQISDTKKHKGLYIQVKKELASKDDILDVKQVLLQKQKTEIQESKRLIVQVESEVLELKNAVQSLQIEKMNLLKQVKQNQINKYNDLMQASQNNPYNSFLEGNSMIQVDSNKQSGQPSAMSNQSLGSEISQKNQGSIAKGKISLIQQNINKKSHDQLSLKEYNKAVSLTLKSKATSSTRNTQIYNNTSSQLGFMNTSQNENSTRMGSQTRNKHILSSQKQANNQKVSSQTNAVKNKQNKSLTVGSNRMKQENVGISGNGSLSQTPNANENIFYSQQIQKNTKIKQKQVHIEKLNSLQGAQQALNNTATAHSALNLTSGLLGPQLQMNMTANPMQQVSQIYSLQGHSDDYKKSRTPDKVKLKSKAKIAKKDVVPGHQPQTGDFTSNKQVNSHPQHLQTANSRSQSQQAQYAQIPERLFASGRGGHAQNQSNTAQRLDGGPQDYHTTGIKPNAAQMSQPKSASMNTTGVLSNQQQKLTSKAKLQNIYSNNQNRKQQFRNNKNHIQSQERQYQQLISSAASLGSQGQQRMTTGASRNGGLNAYNTVSAANIGDHNTKKLGEQKRQVMHNQWVLAQENEKNSQANHNYIHNQEIKTVLKSGLDNSSTGAADSGSLKALQRRCSSQMQNQPTSKPSGQPAKDLDYSRAILNISQSSTDKVKSAKISQSSLNNTQKLKSSSRKGGNSAKRQTQPKLKKEEAPDKYGQEFVNAVFQNRLIPSRDANSSSVLGKVVDDNNTISQMQKQIPRVTNSKGH